MSPTPLRPLPPTLFLLAAPAVAQVMDQHEINDLVGGLASPLEDMGRFGSALASLGDLDGDGAPEVAIGASWTNGPGVFRGRAWILSLDPGGSVVGEVAIDDGLNGFAGPIGNGSRFAGALAAIGPLPAPGVAHLAVGADWDNDGTGNRGAVWILSLDAAGQVAGEQKISATQGGFTGVLDPTDHFGVAVAPLSDRDGDGIGELAVGAYLDDDGGPDRGAVWVLFLDAARTVKGHVKLSDAPGTPGLGLADGDAFGYALANLGDLDGDGQDDLAVGCYEDDDGGAARGAVRILFLGPGGQVLRQQKISATQGGLTATLEDHDHFGSALANAGDLDGDGVVDLAVGVWQDNDGIGSNVGAVYLLFLRTDGTVREHRKISATAGGFGGALGDNDWFGSAVCALGDLDGNGRGDLLVGQWGDDAGGPDRGAAWVLDLGCLDPAGEAFRNAGSNPASLDADAPRLGGAFQASVDLATTGHAFAQVLAFASPATLPLAGGQTLLVNVADPAGELLGLGFQAGPLASFTKPLPIQIAFCGFPVCVQAIHFGGVAPFALSNARDLSLGY